MTASRKYFIPFFLTQAVLFHFIILFFPNPVLAKERPPSSVNTENRVIRGRVSVGGRGMAGVSVQLQGKAAGTVTNDNGDYALSIPETSVRNGKLVFSFVGYATQEIPINDRTIINVDLLPIAGNLDEVILVGTRNGGRVKTESPVPVDVISLNASLQTTARPDLTSLLNYAAPSFNYNKQSGSDGADQIDLATLRGLGPDQTLVLVNGKRRHQTAFVAVFGTRGRGNSGTDLNAIPESAIDRVEILRDGASAQYGSDAIAGVINIILKKDVNKWQIHTGVSGYLDKRHNPYFGGDLKSQYQYGNAIDGQAFEFGANTGFTLGKMKKGFLNLSGNFFSQAKTFRQVLDTDLSHDKSLPINPGRRANGDGSVMTGGIMYNMEVPLSGIKATIYSFGGFNEKRSDAYAYTRTFHGTNPLSSARPARFPTNSNGDLLWDPSIMVSVPTPGGIADTIFNPHIQTHINDASMAVGMRGNFNNGFHYDLSNSTGRNDFHYYGDKTFNSSLGAAGLNRNHFDDGGFRFLQNTSNADFSKNFDGVAQGLNLSAGAEFRYEEYRIYRGEKDSYFNYDLTNAKAAGSQGFPGFQPVDEINATRTVEGLYIQADLDITKKWLTSTALRFENYSDFGSQSTYKFATRYKVLPNLNFRGSISTGYRAPSLQQINFSNTFTNVQGGNAFDVKIAPNYSPITRAAGIPELKQEKSVNASLGFTVRPLRHFTITVDGYWVRIKDRVVLSGQFDNSNAALEKTLDSLHVSQAQFFANAVNTTNTGVDITLNYIKNWSSKHLNLLLAANLQHMHIDKVNVPGPLNKTFAERQAFFSDREQKFVLASAPPVKLGLTIDYGLNSMVSIGTHLTYFGKIALYGYGYANTYPPLVELDNDPGTVLPELFNYYGKMVSDIYGSFRVTKVTTLYLGADNLFNVHPNLGYVHGAKLSAYDGETGGPWDAVQMGVNGLRLFAKCTFNF